MDLLHDIELPPPLASKTQKCSDSSDVSKCSKLSDSESDSPKKICLTIAPQSRTVIPSSASKCSNTNTDNLLNLNLSFPKITLLGKQQAKKRLQAFSALKQNLSTSPNLKKILKPSCAKFAVLIDDQYNEHGEKIDDRVVIKKPPKKGQNHNEKAKAVVEEIEEIKKAQTAIMEEAEQVLYHVNKTRSQSRSREPYKNKRRATRKRKYFDRLDYKSSDALCYPENWAEFKSKHLTLSSLKQLHTPHSEKRNSGDFRKIVNFEVPAVPVSDYKYRDLNGEEKVVPFNYIRYTFKSPSIAYCANIKHRQPRYFTRNQLFTIISKPFQDGISKLINKSSSVRREKPICLTQRNWYPKDILSERTECEILEPSLGLSILKAYSDEEEAHGTTHSNENFNPAKTNRKKTRSADDNTSSDHDSDTETKLRKRKRKKEKRKKEEKKKKSKKERKRKKHKRKDTESDSEDDMKQKVEKRSTKELKKVEDKPRKEGNTKHSKERKFSKSEDKNAGDALESKFEVKRNVIIDYDELDLCFSNEIKPLELVTTEEPAEERKYSNVQNYDFKINKEPPSQNHRKTYTSEEKKGAGTPDTDEYHSHWESDDDDANVISPKKTDLQEKSWSNKNDFKLNLDTAFEKSERSLEMPLNIRNFTRRSYSRKSESDYFNSQEESYDAKVHQKTAADSIWERSEYLKMKNDQEVKKLEEERKLIEEERRKLEIEKRRLAELEKRYKLDIFNKEKEHEENEKVRHLQEDARRSESLERFDKYDKYENRSESSEASSRNNAKKVETSSSTFEDKSDSLESASTFKIKKCVFDEKIDSLESLNNMKMNIEMSRPVFEDKSDSLEAMVKQKILESTNCVFSVKPDPLKPLGKINTFDLLEGIIPKDKSITEIEKKPQFTTSLNDTFDILDEKSAFGNLETDQSVLENEYEEFMKAVTSDVSRESKPNIKTILEHSKETEKYSSSSSSSSDSEDSLDSYSSAHSQEEGIKQEFNAFSNFQEIDIELPDIPLPSQVFHIPAFVPSPANEDNVDSTSHIILNYTQRNKDVMESNKCEVEQLEDEQQKAFTFAKISLPLKRPMLESSAFQDEENSSTADFTERFSKKTEEISKQEPFEPLQNPSVDVPKEALLQPQKQDAATNQDSIQKQKHDSVESRRSQQEHVPRKPSVDKMERKRTRSRTPVRSRKDSLRGRRSRSKEFDRRRRDSPKRRKRQSPKRYSKDQGLAKRKDFSPRRKRDSSPKRSSPWKRNSSPRRRDSSPRRRRDRSHSPRRSRRRESQSPRSKNRSITPERRNKYSCSSPKKESIQITLQRIAGMEDYSNKSPVNSPLDGFKRSLADSTISDEQLLQQHDNYEDSSYSSHFFSRTTDSPASPKRIPLDDRINQVLGIDKETGKPVSTTYNQDYSYNQTYYDQYGQFNQQYDQYNVHKYSHYNPKLQPTTKVVQVGNVLQVVPNEEMPNVPPPVAHKEPETIQKILQVGNMLQIVPTETPQAVVIPLPVVPDKLSAEALMKQKNAERRAEREKRRNDREKRRKEKEKKRKEKEKRKQLKLKLKTENMIKRALLFETEDGVEKEEPPENEEGPAQWPPIPIVVSTNTKVAGKGILLSHGFSNVSKNEEEVEKKKSVKFADGVIPGEGTSPSGGEELTSPPPATQKLPKEKRYTKTKKPKKVKSPKKKIKVKIVRKQPQAIELDEDEEEDNLPPPSPPPGSPPPHIFPPRIKTHTINNIHPSFQANIPTLPVSNAFTPAYRPPPAIPTMPPPPLHHLPPCGPHHQPLGQHHPPCGGPHHAPCGSLHCPHHAPPSHVATHHPPPPHGGHHHPPVIHCPPRPPIHHCPPPPHHNHHHHHGPHH